MSSTNPLSSVAWHDATLEDFTVQWQAGVCSAHVRCTDGHTREISWRGLMLLELHRAQPWGPSASILSLSTDGDLDCIEMQSGDRISVQAGARSVTIPPRLSNER